VLLTLGSVLTVSVVGTFLGLLVLVAAMGLARTVAGAHRRLAAWLLDEPVAVGAPAPPGRGVLGWLDTRLRDGTGWRAVAYVLLTLPVSLLGLYAVLFWYAGLYDLTAIVRWTFSIGQAGGRGMQVFTPLPFGAPQATPGSGPFLPMVFGAAMVLAAPWVTRTVVMVDRWLIQVLLSPTSLAERVRDLEETRALAVDDSVALLRRLERDLHDGAQVRLVALAMSLDMAKEKLGDDGEPLDAAPVRKLLDNAHRNALEALTELRDLARGIHPPVLDDGLPDALASLAARGHLPVDLTVEIPERPRAAIETIAYFCAAELLTNVIKHSGARRAAIEAVQRGEVLRLRVTDDGRGGAHPDAASGLTGLIQRVRTVDGTLDIVSPTGGPTVVTVDLPLHA
jgi:signal transduction histidine kinase